jgi:poly(hydroxyalkanoate) depolymerase family esterase
MKDKTKAAGLREATRLTQAGQLHEAVAIIQRTLRGVPGPKPAAEPRPTARETSAHRPQRHFLLGMASMGHTEPRPTRTETSQKRTSEPPLIFGAGLHGQMREQWRGYPEPRPWSDPIPDRAPDIVPDGGRFVPGSYTNQAGTRSYKLYIPSAYHGQPLPLVVMLHGCSQNPDDFAAGTRMNVLAEDFQCFIAYPAQSQSANGSKCWNWFEPANQQRDFGEPSIIAGLTRQIIDNYRVDKRRIYVAGLSAGGAMAMTLAMTYPDLYAAVGIHSGLPYAVARDLPSAFTAMHGRAETSALWPGANSAVPTIVFHGDRDTTVHPCNSDQVIAQCAPSPAGPGALPESGPAPRTNVERGRIPHGYAYTRTTYHDASGQLVMEHWLVHGAGHAWSGGSPCGSYTDPKGPDASKEMLRFFYEHLQGEISANCH